jgi:hypothetical protein
MMAEQAEDPGFRWDAEQIFTDMCGLSPHQNP